MPTSGSPSSHSHDDSQPVNPYAATAIASPRSAAGPELPDPPPRIYRLQVEWADRRRFLRAVLPLRLYGIVGFFFGGVAILFFVGALFESREFSTFRGFNHVIPTVRTLFVVAKGLLTFYGCWLNWKLADALAATAGGGSSSMTEWSWLQLRLAQVLVATIAMNFASYGWDMFVDLYLLDFLRPRPL
jgi:hypothetical protein